MSASQFSRPGDNDDERASDPAGGKRDKTAGNLNFIRKGRKEGSRRAVTEILNKKERISGTQFRQRNKCRVVPHTQTVWHRQGVRITGAVQEEGAAGRGRGAAAGAKKMAKAEIILSSTQKAGACIRQAGGMGSPPYIPYIFRMYVDSVRKDICRRL